MQEGEAFEAAAEEYVADFLRRGVPSLFSDLRSLYRSVSDHSVYAQLPCYVGDACAFFLSAFSRSF